MMEEAVEAVEEVADVVVAAVAKVVTIAERVAISHETAMRPEMSEAIAEAVVLILVEVADVIVAIVETAMEEAVEVVAESNAINAVVLDISLVNARMATIVVIVIAETVAVVVENEAMAAAVAVAANATTAAVPAIFRVNVPKVATSRTRVAVTIARKVGICRVIAPRAETLVRECQRDYL